LSENAICRSRGPKKKRSKFERRSGRGEAIKKVGESGGKEIEEREA